MERSSPSTPASQGSDSTSTPHTRKEFIARLSESTSTTSDLSCPTVAGIHHLKFAVSDIDVSLAFYTVVLGARRIASLDHVRSDGTGYAVICHVEQWSNIYLELRKNAEQARRDRGWDPVTLSVPARADLVRWAEWFDRFGIVHSTLMVGLRGWLLIFEVSFATITFQIGI